MCVKLGYYIDDDLVVDHINDKSFDDDINNLQILTKEEHNKKSHHKIVNVNSKLTEQQVRQIKFLDLFTNLTQTEIAYMYGVQPAAINKILTIRTWKNIKLDLSNQLLIRSLKHTFRRYLNDAA